MAQQTQQQLPPPRQQGARSGEAGETNQERAKRMFGELRAQLNGSKFRATLASMVPAEFRTTGYVDQLCEGIFLACRDNADLLNCNRASLFRAVERIAKSGLKVGAGGYWCVPYKGEVQEQLDYRGALTLVRRSKMVRKITAQVVYENDRCEIQLGTDEKIDHRPSLAGRGDWIAVYAFAVVQDVDTPEVEVMDREQIERVRDLAPSKNSPAWKNHPDEMARKIALKRLCKRLPLENPDALKDMDDRTIEGVGETVNVDAPTAPPVPQITQGEDVPLDTMGDLGGNGQQEHEPVETQQKPAAQQTRAKAQDRPAAPKAKQTDDERTDPETGEVTRTDGGLPFDEE